ncbi:MAG: acyl-CoA thioesterase [Thermodesulfobacteriota bacterium]
MRDLTTQFPVVLIQELIWGDMDAFAHINNTVYFRYFEDARIAYFEKTGVIEYMENHRIGPILASTQCDFRAPLAYPGRIEIAAGVEAVEAKRFTMAYEVYSRNLEKTAATGRAVIVYYDYANGRSCEIPESIESRICNLEADFNR